MPAPSRIEVFGGYAYTGYSVFDLYSGPWQRFGFSAWDASATVKLVPHIGAEFDFGGASGSNNSKNYDFKTYMAGPRISADFHHLTLYGHALFGSLTFNGPASTANGNGSFATALGGGADY